MKKFILLTLALCLFATTAFAGWVNGYTRKNGTYVSGYNRSDSNGTVRDNYSYKGNKNPYTGKTGSNYYRDNPTSEYFGTSGKSKSSGSKSSIWGW